MYFIGIDLGSSSVKAYILNADTGEKMGSAQYPDHELAIEAPQPGWAEQHPDTWWDCVAQACRRAMGQNRLHAADIKGIGIAYQMHGLVAVDKAMRPVRPAIIWCDSRAVAIGQAAYEALGEDYCLSRLLNTPGNFTAAKLRWVQENEPGVYGKIHRAMLPGDYIALRLTEQATTTASGLSEGTLWDFQSGGVATGLMDHFGFDQALIPQIMPTFGQQGQLTTQAAEALGLKAGIPVAYRAGDQPNNAFSLNVLKAGEIAATAGTSGVVYAVTDKNAADPEGRVNTFKHVNEGHNGVLLCINGSGISYGWLRRLMQAGGGTLSYPALNTLAKGAPVGAKGLCFYPFGNGAERMLGNKNPGASFHGLDFNQHGPQEMARAVVEGVVYALNYGFEVLETMGAGGKTVKAGQANLFLSDTFRAAFVNTTKASLALYNTDGAAGAARGAALGMGYFKDSQEAFQGLKAVETRTPDPESMAEYQAAYQKWKSKLGA